MESQVDDAFSPAGVAVLMKGRKGRGYSMLDSSSGVVDDCPPMEWSADGTAHHQNAS